MDQTQPLLMWTVPSSSPARNMSKWLLCRKRKKTGKKNKTQKPTEPNLKVFHETINIVLKWIIVWGCNSTVVHVIHWWYKIFIKAASTDGNWSRVDCMLVTWTWIFHIKITQVMSSDTRDGLNIQSRNGWNSKSSHKSVWIELTSLVWIDGSQWIN